MRLEPPGRSAAQIAYRRGAHRSTEGARAGCQAPPMVTSHPERLRASPEGSDPQGWWKWAALHGEPRSPHRWYQP